MKVCRFPRRPLLVFGISLFALIVVSFGAQAAMSFCNTTKTAIEAALAYRALDEENKETWVSEGWWRIEPGQCARVFTAPLDQRFYFYFARALSASSPDASPYEWSGKYPFCTAKKAFRIVGDRECAARQYLTSGFRQIDVGTKAKDYSLDFRDDSAR
ncbi:MAG: DUF1036 domain-containing protein [Alphaproteobacteria bacterium]|nr:DUF1036 domain-containing protein [Alphaproteobacteria bacterium]